MKIIAVTQARYGSTRLPGKILKTINGKTLLEIHLSRILRSSLIHNLIVATTNEQGAEHIETIAKKLNVRSYKGSVDDVLERFYYSIKDEKPDYVVRLTSDCPLIDPKEIDKVISACIEGNYDYVSNALEPTLPDGLDTEVFKFSVLEKAYNEATLKSDREHVTPYIWRNSTVKGGTIFRSFSVKNDVDYSKYRITVDNQHDFEVIEKLLNKLGDDQDWHHYIDFLDNNPSIFDINANEERNAGYFKSLENDKKTEMMNKGQLLYKKAKKLIPGGTMLLSKRPEMFLPEQWPSYFSKAKGCKVWDLDGKEYTDVSIMGIGTNILGYGNEEVDEAVMQTIKDGNMSTLNCPEEVFLAEKLIELHPWAQMVRFARSGGEANAIAIRIARAASGKDNVAFCGYHGWHDWYLSANLGDEKNLAGHLLPGLDPLGVPQNLRNTSFPFNYNKYDELVELVNSKNIGVIKMEVSRNMGPEDNFLQKVRKLATDRNIILIFDECTSGFRQTFGGLHKMYGVEPDMAMFGKALGNGYAITATIGKKEIMEATQKTFISSTFWTERIGPTAALATLKVMDRLASWDIITKTGNQIKAKWSELAEKHGLAIDQWGLPALAGFSFKSKNALAYKTYITQEMLSKGFLASNAIYVSIVHTPEILDSYFFELDKIFKKIRDFEDGLEVMNSLKGPICHSGFKRLN